MVLEMVLDFIFDGFFMYLYDLHHAKLQKTWFLAHFGKY